MSAAQHAPVKVEYLLTERRDRPMATVQITPLTDPDELFHHYPGQTEAQPAVLVLNLEDGELTARYNPTIGGGEPASVHHGRILWIGMPTLTAAAANTFFEQVKPLAQRILDGATIKLDRNHANLVGVLNDDAQAAHDELVDLCDPENFETSDLACGLDATEWFSTVSQGEVIHRFDLTPDTTDAEIAEQAAAEEEATKTATEAGYTALTGVEEYLTDLRDTLRQEERDQLAEVAEKISDLKDRRDEMIVRIRAWGDTFRDIAPFAGVSHTEVKRIVDEAAKREKVDPEATVRQSVIDVVTGFSVTLARPSDWNAANSDWNWAAAATEQWIEKCRMHGLYPEVRSTEVGRPERQAAIVGIVGVTRPFSTPLRFVIEVHDDDEVRAVEVSELERYHVIEIDGSRFVTGYTDVNPDFRGLSLCYDGEEIEQPADLADAAKLIRQRAGSTTVVQLVKDERLTMTYGQDCWVPDATG